MIIEVINASCAGAMQCKISQSGRMELQDIAGLRFDVLAGRIKPLTWEEFFVRIPIQEQKETNFVYDTHLNMEGYLPRGAGVTIHKMLESHPFGHLIAENMKHVLQMSRVYVFHHSIAYGCGNEASLIHQLLHVDADDNDDDDDDDDDDDSEEEDNVNVDEGPSHTHSLFALQGLGREAKAIELFVSSDSNCFCTHV